MRVLISAVLAVSVLAGIAGQASASALRDGGPGSTLTWDPSGNRWGP